MLLPVAKVSKLFGAEAKGGVVLSLYNTFPDNFDTEEPLFANVDSLTVPLFCGSFERRGQTGAVVEFDDFDTARRAQELVGRELTMQLADNDAEAADDEFYMEDLIGFEAVAGSLRGEVTDYYDSDINPLLGVTFGGEEHLIPAVEQVVVGIDFDARRVELTLPEGLLEINR